jgi:hypothetical protein
MNKGHVTRLEIARNEIYRFSEDLGEKVKRKELSPLEHKIIIHQKLHGKEPHEILGHIDKEINHIHETEESNKRIGIAMIITALIISFAFLISPWLYDAGTPETPTAHVVEVVGAAAIAPQETTIKVTAQECELIVKEKIEHGIDGDRLTVQFMPGNKCNNKSVITTEYKE